MTVLLRVLFIEADEGDIPPILRELQQGGFEVSWTRTDTKVAMEHALRDGAWDLVVCDPLTPNFNSAMALDVMRTHARDIPFIIVSAAAPEDVVTAAMGAGAHDFISKRSLLRLVPAVRRELREAVVRRERKRIATRLTESEARFGSLADSPSRLLRTSAAVVITDTDGTISDANTAFHSLTGLPVSEIQGWVLWDLLEKEEVGKAIRQAAKGSPWDGQMTLPGPGGTPLAIELTCSPVRNSEGEIGNLVMVMRVVAKEAELERERCRTQKMDALGSQAAGVSQDFNNTLAASPTSTNFTERKPSAGSSTLPKVDVIPQPGLPAITPLPLDSGMRCQGSASKPFTAFDPAPAAYHASANAEKTLPKGRVPVREGHARQERLILLAEDSHVTRSMIKTWLEHAGCGVIEAKDGMEAWNAFKDGPHHGRFALVLTDVVMPKMDGLELTRLVRQADPAIPIAILTSNEDKDTVKSALNLGVNEFLNKPFEYPELIQCVENLLALRHSRMTTRRSVETAKAVRLAQKAMVAVPEKDLPLFTLHEPLTDAGGDAFRCMKCADGSILFILADVAGHSVISSYAVASFLGMLSTYVSECQTLMVLASGLGCWDSETVDLLHCCGRYGKIPCDPLRHLAVKFNQGIQNGPFSEVPICVLLGLWTPASGRLKLLNAGIPHGLLGNRNDQKVFPLQLNGTPLGIFPEPMVEACTLWLEPGSRLLFGTDGFFDVLSSSKQPFHEMAPKKWGALREFPIDLALGTICEEARHHGAGFISDDLLVVSFEQPQLTQAPDELVLRIPSIPRAIDIACDRVAECIRFSGQGRTPDKARLFDILLAVREALSNAVAHGNQHRPGTSVLLRCWSGKAQGTVSVAVADEGPGFDLDAYSPPLDPLSERGRGIPLIQAYAQEVRMVGGELTMTFQIEEMTHDNR
jgi:PAS domain S-box-containing protein